MTVFVFGDLCVKPCVSVCTHCPAKHPELLVTSMLGQCLTRSKKLKFPISYILIIYPRRYLC